MYQNAEHVLTNGRSGIVRWPCIVRMMYCTWLYCTVPCTCIMNFSGSSVWTSAAGQEMAIVGTTPDNIKAEIRKDASNIFRRRDLSATGVVTWTVC